MCKGLKSNTNVSASIPIKAIENILNMFIYLIAVGKFEVDISVHVLEGWLSDYAPSTTSAPTTLKITNNIVLKADFNGQYIDMSDFSKNLAAWKVIVESSNKTYSTSYILGIANINNSIIKININGHTTTIKCSLNLT